MNVVSVTLLVLVYFLPSLADGILNKNVRSHVFLVNVLLGWTVIGWVYAFIWVYRENKRKRRHHWHNLSDGF